MAAVVVAGFADTDFPGGLGGRRVCVAGLGISGLPAAQVLAGYGALVTAVDSRDDDERRGLAGALARSGGRVLLGEGAATTLPPGTEMVGNSPGLKPSA